MKFSNEKIDPQTSLDYAKFFLQKTIDSIRNDNLEYEPYLNAFIVFAKSVGFCIEKKYSKKSGYKNWNKSIKDKHIKTFKPFTDLRNIIEKEGGIVPSSLKQSVSFGPNGVSCKKGESIIFSIGGGNKSNVTKEVNGKLTLIENSLIDCDLKIITSGNKPIVIDNFITQSKKYITILQDIVNEAHSKFDK